MVFKAVSLDDKTIRIITGSLCDEIILDWEKLSLDQIAHIFDTVLIEELSDASLIAGDDLTMFRGGSHIDLVDQNVGSLGAFSVRDIRIPRID